MCYEKIWKVDKDFVEEWLHGDACERDFRHVTDTNIVNAAMKQKGEEDNESEKEGGNSELLSHSMAL